MLAELALHKMCHDNEEVWSAVVGWARDLPAEAHGSRGEAVVTAPTPGHFHCMRLLERDGILVTAEEPAKVSLTTTVWCALFHGCSGRAHWMHTSSFLKVQEHM